MQEPNNMPKNPAEQKAQIDAQLAQLMSETAAKNLMASIEGDVEKWYNANAAEQEAMITSLLDQAEQSTIANLPIDVQQDVDKEQIHEMMHSNESKEILRLGFKAGLSIQRNQQFDQLLNIVRVAVRVIAIANITIGIAVSLVNPVLGIGLVNMGVAKGLEFEIMNGCTTLMLYCIHSLRKHTLRKLPNAIQDTLNQAINLSVKQKPVGTALVD